MKRLSLLILIFILSAFAVPALAQDAPPPNTVTVVGTGSASGSPDVANIQFGVEMFSEDLSSAFSDVNTTINDVITALVDAGVAREDIRTVGLNVYQDRGMSPMPMESAAADGPRPVFNVSNQIRVIVRDINTVPDVINAALAAGSNQIYGLDFQISDTETLLSTAREDAVANANARAAELAGLFGASLGEVVTIEEVNTGGFGMYDMAMAEGRGGGGGATIEPGQLSVQLQIRVTYALNR